jgi:hypothetical protein
MKIAHRCGSDQHEDACADDAPDAEACQIPDSQGLLEPMFRMVTVGEDSLDGFGAEKGRSHVICYSLFGNPNASEFPPA